MSRPAYIVLDVVLAAVGLALFIYGDLSTHRQLRLAALLVLTIAAVFGTILAARRDDS
jgi:hypothetical protein